MSKLSGPHSVGCSGRPCLCGARKRKTPKVETCLRYGPKDDGSNCNHCLRKRVAELEAALAKIASPTVDNGGKTVIARDALGLRPVRPASSKPSGYIEALERIVSDDSHSIITHGDVLAVKAARRRIRDLEAQVAEARGQAINEAANVADGYSASWIHDGEDGVVNVAHFIAEDIRALLSSGGGETGPAPRCRHGKATHRCFVCAAGGGE